MAEALKAIEGLDGEERKGRRDCPRTTALGDWPEQTKSIILAKPHSANM
jgi:hypothetical protein